MSYTNTSYRVIIIFNCRIIRLTSPNLNYLIAVGAIVLYIDVCFVVVPSTSASVVSVLCNITPWLTAIGYSLCFGTIITKMFRLYYIFNNPSAKKIVSYDCRSIIQHTAVIQVHSKQVWDIHKAVLIGLQRGEAPKLLSEEEY